MSMQVVVSLSPNTAIVNYKGKTELFQSDSPEYQTLKSILKKDVAVRNQELVKFVEGYRADKKPGAPPKNVDYRATPEGVYINGEAGEMLLPRVLGERLLEFVAENLPVEPIISFAKRLALNPSHRSVQRAFDFLEQNHNPLLSDGRVLAWRKVRRNSEGKLVDIRTGTVDNSVGQTPRMPRNEVDDNDEVTCSRGYHASNFSYACNHYGNHNDVMIEVAVCPSDIVSVPRDYNQSKMRICAYEVLNVCEAEDTSNLKDHQKAGSFAVDPNDDNSCDDCGEDLDFCSCGNEDDEDWDDDDSCDCCGEEFDDCSCDDE